MRELADWQPDQYARITAWPLREAVLAFEQRLKRQARADYSAALLRYAVLAPHLADARDRRAPEPPAILLD